MHQSAMFYGQRFFDAYCAGKKLHDVTVVDIGSQDVNGSLREVCPSGVHYIGLDFVEGNGVDIIIDDPYKLPLLDASADIIVSSSCFEHSEFFWLVFLEAMRVLKDDGVFYLNAPSNGFFHQWPVDCWRFYPDAGHAMVAWAKRNGMSPVLLESFIGKHSAGGLPEGGMWSDFVAVFLKNDSHLSRYPVRVVDGLPEFFNGYSNSTTGVLRHKEFSPDFLLIESKLKEIEQLGVSIAERNNQIDLLSHQLVERQNQMQELEKNVEDTLRLHTLQIAETEQANKQLRDVFSSRSWRITAPLRSVMNVVYEVPRKTSRWIRATYHALPITSTQRMHMKNFVFLFFGFLFTKTEAYRNWKVYRKLSATWAAVEASSEKASGDLVNTRITSTLQSANGVWEWQDYDVIKSRIARVKHEQLSHVVPSRLNIIDIGNEAFASVAAKIKLPAVPAEPDVSIILPVFNNLKLTLECLLSIVAHTDNRVSFEVILADDASTDQTAEVLGKIEHLRVLRHDQNLGFLRNCNKALEQVQGRYVLYLNNDVQVTLDWLVNLYQTFVTQKNVGAVGPKFIYPSGHLQEAGVAFRHDGTADMVGLNADPEQPRYNYIRRVDYISGACLMLPTSLARQLEGFSEDFLPCYCEDSDLCLRVQAAGYHVYYNPMSTIIHHLSKTTAAIDSDAKFKNISTNLVKLQHKWLERFDQAATPKVIAFYLPQFHPFPENDIWWGAGFTEWTNVTKAQPNFIGHDQPRLPADLGFYDLRVSDIMQQQADLAKRYGIHGFCFYYYWFGGKRLLDLPIENMLTSGKPEMPFCLCWANENWTRRWDGQDHEVLMAQAHSSEDDIAIIQDLIRYFRDPRYIQIDGRPFILVYRVTLFPDFAATVARWREVCREQGIGEIYVAMVESMELTNSNKHPQEFGCDAAVEFPPQGMANPIAPSGKVVNPEFTGSVADYRDIAVRYATRDFPGYTRFKGVMPGWDNTARRQNNGFCFEQATPGAFQAWLEETVDQTRQQHYGDERLVFVNAWNEWAEGAYLEPDRRFGHSYLEAVKGALESSKLLRKGKYWHGN